MTINSKSHSDLDVIIPLAGLMKNLDSFSQDMINKHEMDQVLCKRVEAASGFLKEYFTKMGIEFLHELNGSKVLANMRLYLRVFAPDELEPMCLQLISKFLQIGLKLHCIDQISTTYWTRVSPIQWFRDNTPCF